MTPEPSQPEQHQHQHEHGPGALAGLRGLARGLAVTLGTLGRRTVTNEYPEVAPTLPPRSRGVIALMEENCTVCMLCARECPAWCIYIDSHKETVSVEGAARDRQRNVLDRFAIDYGLCMYCGICVEVCPFDAIFWSPQFEYSTTDAGDLTHERERLREWMWTVPPPPALDPGAPDPKELAAPTRPAAKRAAAGREGAGRGGAGREGAAGRAAGGRATGGRGATAASPDAAADAPPARPSGPRPERPSEGDS